MRLNKKIKVDNLISIALMSTFVVLTTQYFLLLYINTTPIFGINIQLLSKIIVGAIYIFVFPFVLNGNYKKVLIIVYLSIIIFFLNNILFPETNQYMSSIIYPFFTVSLPSFIFALSIKDFKTFEKYCNITAKLITILCILIGISVLILKKSIGPYSIAYSYYILFPLLIFINAFMNKISIIKGIEIIVLTFLTLSLGSRGPILCIIVFIAVKFIKTYFKFNIYSFFVLGISFIFLRIIFSNYKVLLSGLNNLLISNNIQSRTLALFLKEEVFLSGRDSLYNMLMEEINRHLFFGTGIGGDRVILGGYYAHNIFLEVAVQFGVLLSLIFFIYIFFTLYIKSRTIYGDFYLLWFALGFLPLLVSSSYLIFINFWIFLGVLLRRKENV